MKHDYTPDNAPRRHAVLRTALRLAVVLAVALLVKLGLDALTTRIALLEASAAARAMTGLIATVLVGYALLIAIPFVPGVEIGIAILVIEGASAAPFVYLATLSGMSLAFLTGQYVALNWLIKTCEDLYLFRLSAVLQRIENRPSDQRLATLNDRLPNWLAPFLVRYRYVTLALLINIPGNIAIGGGGGIMMATGLSRLFQTGLTLLTVALATLPVPLAVWLLGTTVLE
ncbi:hypothetical protein [Yoonia sp.]|jgi:hypothetical protein|uniref:hypothetical protein n=1 Tax=Yoonia sp. TaxID=2212373 RepID=UPI0025FFCFE9|nr:hypothetical protein [Yoonia sp.]